MTAAEYLSEHLFPLTHQQGLTLEQQLALDATNYDEYEAALKNHRQLNEHERAVGFELEAKHVARGNVMRQIQGETGIGSPQGPDGRPLA